MPASLLLYTNCASVSFRYVVKLYQVINWTETDPAHWGLAADSWECNSRRIVFYDGRQAPAPLITKWMTREAYTSLGGHGWTW